MLFRHPIFKGNRRFFFRFFHAVITAVCFEMLPVTGDISADGGTFLYVDVFYKGVSADIDCVFRAGQGTAQIVFLYLRPV